MHVRKVEVADMDVGDVKPGHVDLSDVDFREVESPHVVSVYDAGELDVHASAHVQTRSADEERCARATSL